MRGLTQLAGRQPDIVIPAQQTMREFIEDVLHREFYTVIYQDLAKRTKSGLLHQVKFHVNYTVIIGEVFTLPII